MDLAGPHTGISDRGLSLTSTWGLAAGLFAIGAAMSWAINGTAVAPILETRWLLAWQDGVTRRGLVGTVGRILSGGYGPTREGIFAAATVFQLAAVAAISVGFAWLSGPRRLIAAGVVLSAVGVPSIAVGLGRLDHLVVVLTVAAAVAVVRDRLWVAGGMLAVAAAVHEVSILLVGVWLAAFAWHRTGRSAAAGRILAIPALVVAALWVAGSPPSWQALAATLEHRTDVALDRETIAYTLAGTGTNVRATVAWIFGEGRWLAAGSLAAAVPVFVFVIAAMRSYGVRWATLPVSARALLAASAAPLLLMPLGVDWGRWVTFSMLTFAASALVVMPNMHAPRWVPIGTLTVILAGVLAGPMTAHGLTMWIGYPS